MKAPYVILGLDVDFDKRIPVFITVRNYELNAKWPEGNVINVLGFVFREGKGFTGAFRLRYPSGSKQQVEKFRPNPNYEEVKHDITVKIDDILVDMMHATKLDEIDIPIPPIAQDPDGFQAILTASDLFDMDVKPRA